MKKWRRICFSALATLLLLSLCSCGKKEPEDNRSYYPDTELENLETFTSVTNIELNISEDAPESNSIIYNYIMDNNAEGVGSITKYESYLKEYGFEKVDKLSSDVASVYTMDGYGILTGSFVVQSNVLQYVISIPSKKNIT